MGQYREFYLKALAERRPKEYARRKGTPSLDHEADEAEARAQAQHDQALHHLLTQHPEPKDFGARVQHLQTLSEQARELALDDLLPEPEPETSPG